MTETPDQTIARLQAELQAAEAQAHAAPPPPIPPSQFAPGQPGTPYPPPGAAMPPGAAVPGDSPQLAAMMQNNPSLANAVRMARAMRQGTPGMTPGQVVIMGPGGTQIVSGGAPGYTPGQTYLAGGSELNPMLSNPMFANPMFAGMMGGRAQLKPPSDTNLSPAPRKVPLAFHALLFPWSWWTVFTLFMISVAPIALWLFVPWTGAVVAAITFVVVLFLRVRKNHEQLSLLKWGRIATVTDAGNASTGTYYSGTTYQNVRLAQAHEWDVTRQWYSGPGTTTHLEYQLDGGGGGQLTLHGLPYDNGVVLAHSKKPQVAMCVSQFPYDLDRDPSGNWIGKLPGRVIGSSIAMTLFLFAWTAAMIIICLHFHHGISTSGSSNFSGG